MDRIQLSCLTNLGGGGEGVLSLFEYFVIIIHSSNMTANFSESLFGASNGMRMSRSCFAVRGAPEIHPLEKCVNSNPERQDPPPTKLGHLPATETGDGNKT